VLLQLLIRDRLLVLVCLFVSLLGAPSGVQEENRVCTIESQREREREREREELEGD
jgi:hypothetical protein